jgi:hypothetical protein
MKTKLKAKPRVSRYTVDVIQIHLEELRSLPTPEGEPSQRIVKEFFQKILIDDLNSIHESMEIF